MHTTMTLTLDEPVITWFMIYTLACAWGIMGICVDMVLPTRVRTTTNQRAPLSKPTAAPIRHQSGGCQGWAEVCCVMLRTHR